MTTGYVFDDNAWTTTGVLESYTYDTRGLRVRLLSATPSSGPATVYSWDDDGRRTVADTGGGAAVVTTIYDDRGLATSIVASGSSSGTETRSYDAAGRLVRDVNDGVNHDLLWDPNSPTGVAQILDVRVDGVTAHRQHYGFGRIATVTTTNGVPATSYPYATDGHGSTIDTGHITAPTGYDAYGKPSGTGAASQFGYRSEYTINGLVHLRARDYDPTTGTFTTRDPLDGVPGTAMVANPYHYTDNDPLNQTDPTGMRPQDGDLTQGGLDTRVQLDLTGEWAEPFKRLGRVEMAGFIWERESTLGPFGLYKGDGREYSQGAIPITNSRFFASLDFNQGRGFIQVNHTESVDGQRWPAWPIQLNPPSSGGGPIIAMIQPPCRQTRSTNDFSLGVGNGGNTLRFTWSVVHGDRRPISGLVPTDCARPAFSGSLFINRDDNAYSFDYAGGCFPSVEVHALVGSQRHIVMQNRNSAPSKMQQLPPFHRGCDMRGSVGV